MSVMATELPPLSDRIELAEAFIELVWERRKTIPDGRGFDSIRAAAEKRAVDMECIDLMLDKLAGMYLARDLGIEAP